jgi:hypothetical protein
MNQHCYTLAAIAAELWHWAGTQQLQEQAVQGSPPQGGVHSKLYIKEGVFS